jgi:hypothetical protein
MKDIYREMMKRSVADAVADASDIEDIENTNLPPEAVVMIAATLYQHRIEDWRVKQSQSQYPDDSRIGRQ